MSLASMPGSSALITISFSFSKMSTGGFQAVVDAGISHRGPMKSANLLNSRKASHFMSDTVLPPLDDTQRTSTNRPALLLPPSCTHVTAEDRTYSGVWSGAEWDERAGSRSSCQIGKTSRPSPSRCGLDDIER